MEKTNVQHVEDGHLVHGKLEGNTIDVQAAQLASQGEHDLTLPQAIKAYPRAIFWSFIVSLTIIMEGYDIVLIGNLYGQPAFARKYGGFYSGIGYQLSAPWQVALGNGSTIGTVIGAVANGYLTFRFGYRPVLLCGLMSIIGFIFITFFAVSIEMLLVGEILSGIPWGMFAIIAPAYASEICPTALRGYLTVYVSLCWGLGQLIATGVLQGVVSRTDEWAYRIPFAVQWAWPVPLFCLLWFAPESPWWLVRNGHLQEAERSLQRLSSPSTNIHAKDTIAMMLHTEEIEKEIEAGSSYWDCFKGVNLRRTEICCVAWAAQIWCGQIVNGSYFFENVGLSVSVSYKISVGTLALSCVGTILSWFLMIFFGRRTLYVYGLAGLSLLMLIIGFASLKDSEAAGWAQSVLLVIYQFYYYLTVGPVCYALMGEISAARVRAKTISLARLTYYISQIIANVVEPYMINPTQGNFGGKVGFFWGGACLVCTVWAYWRLPEPKGRTFEELDLLFAKRVSARKFKGTFVNAYDYAL